MSAAVVAKFHAHLQQAPAAPSGDRVLVRPFAPTETQGGLHIPNTAQERPYAGSILALGDSAADKAWDHDHRIGDEIWYSKYAGVIEQWHRLTKGGQVHKCPHDGIWELIAVLGDRTESRRCRACGAERVTEPIIAINIDDIIANVGKQIRFERGEIRRERRQTADGRTQYVIERLTDEPDSLEINAHVVSKSVQRRLAIQGAAITNGE